MISNKIDFKPQDLNLEWLAGFIAFAEHLNFTRAAEEMHISQPAIHMHVQKLSRTLGVALYQRRGNSMALTSAGQEVVACGRELLARSRDLRASLHAIEAVNPVVMCSGEGAYLYLLGDAIRRFQARSKAPLQLLARNAEATIEAVTTGEADIGVVPVAGNLPGLAVEPILDVGQMLVVPQTHSLAGRKRIRVSDLDGERLIVPPRPRPQRLAIEQLLTAAGVRWEVAVEVHGWPTMLHFVSLGVGLALVNDFCRLPRNVHGIPFPPMGHITYCALRRARGGVRGRPEAQDLWRLLVGP